MKRNLFNPEASGVFFKKKRAVNLKCLQINSKKYKSTNQLIFSKVLVSGHQPTHLIHESHGFNPEFRTPACARANWAPASREPRSTQRQKQEKGPSLRK